MALRLPFADTPTGSGIRSGNGTSLRDSIAIQFRVVGALLMREILSRYGRHNIGFMWFFVEPMTFTLAVTTLWTSIGLSHGFPIVAFAITGYSSVLLWRNMPSRCEKAVQANHTLMHHRNVRLIDVYISRLLLEGAGATTSFLVLTVCFCSIGWMELPVNPEEVFLGWLMLAWFGSALALSVGALGEKFEFVHTLWHPASYIAFPLSGAGFSVDALPLIFQNVVLLLPMVHGVEIVREGYFGPEAYTAHYSFGYMASFNLGLTLFGLSQVRDVSRKITV